MWNSMYQNDGIEVDGLGMRSSVDNRHDKPDSCVAPMHQRSTDVCTPAVAVNWFTGMSPLYLVDITLPRNPRMAQPSQFDAARYPVVRS